MQTKLGDGSVMICGIVGKDAEVKRVGEKNSVLTKFSVKVGEKTVDGEKRAVWVNCTAWNDMGKAASLLRKGDTALAVGRIQKHTYQEKEYSELVCEFLNAVCRSTLPDIGSADVPPPDNGYEYTPDEKDLPFF